MVTRCWFQSVFPHECEWRFDGRPDPCHLIPWQRLKFAGQREQGKDPRIIRDGCRHAHRRIDGFDALNKVELTLADYPESVREFADEYGWFFAGPRVGWIKQDGWPN